MSLHVSPSLQEAGRWANEVKFEVSREKAAGILAWAGVHLVEDVNSRSHQAGYLINSLYLDTPDFGVYHKAKGCRVSKFRVRRYGDSEKIFLEQKRKKGCRVTKRRVAADEELLQNLCPCDLAPEAPQRWFCEAVDKLQLRPVSLVSYHRLAFNGVVNDETLRLTLDQDIVASPCSEWKVQQVIKGYDVHPDGLILELKFPDALPIAFRELLEEFRLVEAGFSKYRSACESLWQLKEREAVSCRAS